MTRQEWWKQHAHVVEAYYKDGAEVECLYPTSQKWKLVEWPSWHLNSLYRIKEEMKKEPTDTGGPAYPCGPMGSSFTSETGITTHQFDAHPGMTLLDYFAGQAVQGILANPDAPGKFEHSAFDAYGYATAMLTERKRRGL